jgi:uncharacterized SAM-dependent methyltransferase
VSLVKQDVYIGESNLIRFEKDETLFTEISQKYSIEEINQAAFESGFTPVAYFFDSNRYFTDVVWKVEN